jgi:acyl dehydratase
VAAVPSPPAPEIGPALVGHALPPVAWTWDERDAILYALGIGARLPEDLAFLYEGRGGDGAGAGDAAGPRVAPTFALAAVTLALPPLVAALAIDLRALLHATQSIALHRVPPAHGRATVTRRITGVWDKGRAALVDCEDVIEDAGGPLATARSAWWIAGAGGFGGPRADPATPPAPAPPPQDRAPDVRHQVRTTTQQAALHRLSGDRNPVHIDPELARAAGQPRPFLHGLCTFGALGHALDRAAGPGRRLATLEGRFTRPVFPGDALDVEAWWTGADAAACAVAVGGETVLGPARATFTAAPRRLTEPAEAELPPASAAR